MSKFLKQHIKNISKKVEINFEISKIFVIFVMSKFFESFLFIVFVFKFVNLKGSHRNFF